MLWPNVRQSAQAFTMATVRPMPLENIRNSNFATTGLLGVQLKKIQRINELLLYSHFVVKSTSVVISHFSEDEPLF